jgi:hypothetical protein
MVALGHNHLVGFTLRGVRAFGTWPVQSSSEAPVRETDRIRSACDPSGRRQPRLPASMSFDVISTEGAECFRSLQNLSLVKSALHSHRYNVSVAIRNLEQCPDIKSQKVIFRAIW